MMKTKFVKVCVFLLALVILQQGLSLTANHSRQWSEQVAIIEQQDIDPAAIFYIESDLALAAEKKVRQQISEPKGE